MILLELVGLFCRDVSVNCCDLQFAGTITPVSLACYSLRCPKIGVVFAFREIILIKYIVKNIYIYST